MGGRLPWLVTSDPVADGPKMALVEGTVSAVRSVGEARALLLQLEKREVSLSSASRTKCSA